MKRYSLSHDKIIRGSLSVRTHFIQLMLKSKSIQNNT